MLNVFLYWNAFSAFQESIYIYYITSYHILFHLSSHIRFLIPKSMFSQLFGLVKTGAPRVCRVRQSRSMSSWDLNSWAQRCHDSGNWLGGWRCRGGIFGYPPYSKLSTSRNSRFSLENDPKMHLVSTECSSSFPGLGVRMTNSIQCGCKKL